jgi:hypothetical protein
VTQSTTDFRFDLTVGYQSKEGQAATATLAIAGPGSFELDLGVGSSDLVLDPNVQLLFIEQ